MIHPKRPSHVENRTMSSDTEALSEKSFTSIAPDAPPAKRPRLVSLDQLRGLTVASMFVVNFSGGLKAMPEVIKHHNVYESLADWIMMPATRA